MRRGTEDKCDRTGYVFRFQTLESGEKKYYSRNQSVKHICQLSVKSALLLSYSHTLQLLSPDRCCGA